MALTPVEIRHIKPSRSLLGYNRKIVDELLEDIVESFEQVWRERADLADKVERPGEEVEHRLVRAAVLGRLGDANLPRVPVPACDPGPPGAGRDPQLQPCRRRAHPGLA